MPRTRIMTRQERRKRADQEEKVRLAQMKADIALEQIDEIEKRAKNQVDTQIKLIHARTDKRLLDMKMSDFLNLNLKYFTEYKSKAPEPPASRARSCSISTDRARSRTPQISRLPQQLAQSVDRRCDRRYEGTPQKQNQKPTVFVRYPRAGELVLSSSGSPLAVQTAQREDCADVHIPTKKGVITVKPHKIQKVNREVLMQLDANVISQVKTLKNNLEVLMELATQMDQI